MASLSDVVFTIIFIHSIVFIHCRAEEGYMQCNGTSWKIFQTLLTYTQARDHCQTEDARLAAIRTSEARACYKEALSKLDIGDLYYFWVGMTDLHQEGHYVWEIDGMVEAANSSNWQAGQPGPRWRSSGQDCGYALRNGFLGDQNCSVPMPFVCQAHRSVRSTASDQIPSVSATSQGAGVGISTESSNGSITVFLNVNSGDSPSDVTPDIRVGDGEARCEQSSTCSGLSTAGVIVTALSACVISSLATSLVCVCLGIHRHPEYTPSLRSGASSRADQRASVLTRSDVSHMTGMDIQRPLPRTPEIGIWPKSTAAYEVVVLHNPVCCRTDATLPTRASSPHYIQFSQS